MLTLVDRPAIEYIVDELIASGISEILVVVSRGKEAIQNHLHGIASGTADGCSAISYVLQREMKGTGNAVLYAKNFAGSEPFVVIYPDDIMVSAEGITPVTAQICAAYEKHGRGAVAMKSFPPEDVSKYSSLKIEPLENNQYKITDMIEKPQKHEAFSNYSIMGRCVLPTKIFAVLEETEPGLNGEIWLTDAMKVLAREEGMIGVDFNGVRYDTGNKLGFLKAVTELGLRHAEGGGEFEQYLRELWKLKNLPFI